MTSQIDYVKMEEYATRLKDVATKIETELGHLTTDLYSRIGADGAVWSGDSAAETKAQFDAFSAKFTEFVSLVNTASTNLNTAAQNYRNLENKIMGQSV